MTFTSPYEESYPPSVFAAPEVLRASRAAASELPDGVEHFTIPQIQQWVDEHEEQAQTVFDREHARGAVARITLLDWLGGVINTNRPEEEEEEEAPT